MKSVRERAKSFKFLVNKITSPMIKITCHHSEIIVVITCNKDMNKPPQSFGDIQHEPVFSQSSGMSGKIEFPQSSTQSFNRVSTAEADGRSRGF